MVLFDNGKLDPRLGSFERVFDVLRARLTRVAPGATVTTVRKDLLRVGIDRVTEVLDEIVAARPAGVIIGICDYGVCQPTALLALALEGRGIPTSVICQSVGFQSMAAAAAQTLPGLPLAVLGESDAPAWWLASGDQIAAAAEEIAERVLEGLTAAPDLLRARADPALRVAPQDPSGLIELAGNDPSIAFTALMRESGFGDGLPFVAPTLDRVSAMLAAADADPALAVWPVVLPRAVPLTAREVAAIAVLAGCEPRWFRVVLAAYRAMADPAFRLAQAAITTNPSGTLVLVSGPASRPLGLADGAGSLGPGHPANATIGRAAALAYSFGLGARVGATDLSLQGSPAKYSYCCAENLEESPWPGLHAERFDAATTSVTVFKCEGPRSVGDNTSTRAEDLFRTIARSASSIGSANAHHPGETVVFLNPAHARIAAAAGWSKDDVRRFLFAESGFDRAEVDRVGRPSRRPAWMDELERVPIAERPEDFMIVVTGAGGLHTLVAPPWGPARSVTVAL